QRLAQYDRILFQFPMYWYSAPALMKKYEDDVFSKNFIA
ncbi:NAD(P)H-dependent oxidoreductase, partial [Enterococcus lactis]